ncbi:hypothetical protein [Pseudoalteromonas sp. G4]|uniref:hypothetical protein n=1 Tax=Pseudoalteromonas sp. G4 TaxID=2992761 RepID=UPI00237E1D08|nr:hypothetical protein [Pseudoalteromonas sp. G4]MDE3272919.1 hypothetical protein [Pseudoalteromonas sp. G4]
MSYRIQFAQLNNGVSAEQAKSILTTKLKLSDAKASQFLAGKQIFSPIAHEKAVKQQKTFAALGIQVDIISTSKSNAQERTNDVDERILAALDYITTSIIRLEEKVDDLARLQQLQNGETDLELEAENTNSWGEDLEFDETLETTSKSKNINWLFIVLIVILLSLLGVVIAFPDLLPF